MMTSGSLAPRALALAAILAVAGFASRPDAPPSPSAAGDPNPAVAQPATGTSGSQPPLAPATDTSVASHLAEATPEPEVLEVLTGGASYYANSLAGRRTASGERYDPRALMAAHRHFPFGTIVRVTNPANGRSVVVRVVDRGPFAKGRVLDLSRRAAEQIGMIRRGHAQVRIEVLSYGDR